MVYVVQSLRHRSALFASTACAGGQAVRDLAKVQSYFSRGCYASFFVLERGVCIAHGERTVEGSAIRQVDRDDCGDGGGVDGFRDRDCSSPLVPLPRCHVCQGFMVWFSWGLILRSSLGARAQYRDERPSIIVRIFRRLFVSARRLQPWASIGSAPWWKKSV